LTPLANCPVTSLKEDSRKLLVPAVTCAAIFDQFDDVVRDIVITELLQSENKVVQWCMRNSRRGCVGEKKK
jgi:hypothetical protein